MSPSSARSGGLNTTDARCSRLCSRWRPCLSFSGQGQRSPRSAVIGSNRVDGSPRASSIARLTLAALWPACMRTSENRKVDGSTPPLATTTPHHSNDRRVSLSSDPVLPTDLQTAVRSTAVARMSTTPLIDSRSTRTPQGHCARACCPRHGRAHPPNRVACRCPDRAAGSVGAREPAGRRQRLVRIVTAASVFWARCAP